jgi:DNA-directed RNA polymerase specialized sigma24 family protein
MESRGGHEERSDAELIRGVADCDREAFAALYRRHLPAVLRFLASETRDPELTADLAAEVFAAVALAAARYRPTNPTAAPWLIGIARNTLGRSRRRGRVESRARRSAQAPIAGGVRSRVSGRRGSGSGSALWRSRGRSRSSSRSPRSCC